VSTLDVPPDGTGLLLTDCRLVDGAGNPWVRADILIEGDRIAAIAPPGVLGGRRRRRPPAIVDAGGRYITPGFVDPHTHSDLTVLTCPAAESAVYQGVTTHVVGNCGSSPAPVDDAHLDDLSTAWHNYFEAPESWDWRTFAEYLGAIESAGCAINVGALVGHGTLRVAAMGFARRAATRRELAVMKRLLRESLGAGALGLSTGLVYPPGCYADTAELVALATVVAEFGGIYASHVRGERETILDAVAEAIRIGDEGGVPVEVSHNAPKWGGPPAAENLGLIDAARTRGLDVTLDNDTHTDLAPRLSRALPQPLLDLSVDELIAVLSGPDDRAKLRKEIAGDARPGAGYSGLLKHGRFDRIVVLRSTDSSLLGLSVADIAARRGRDPLDTFLDLIVEERDGIVGIFDYIDEEQIRTILAHPLSMVSSDGLVLPIPETDGDIAYWPCSYGEYTGLLERYVRDRPILRLEEAVRKMTSAPAQRFGLWDRGLLRPGLRADLIMFDLERVRDRATNLFPHSYPFENIPPRYAEGIDLVLVNGAAVVWEGEHTGRLPGRVLRGPGRRVRKATVPVNG
jgi:N-acyl-D-amino-acid deacylase